MNETSSVAGVFTLAAPDGVDPHWREHVQQILQNQEVPHFFEAAESSADWRFRGFNGQPEGFTSVVDADLRLVNLTCLQDLPRYLPPAMRRLEHQMRGQSGSSTCSLPYGGVTLFTLSTKFWRECLDLVLLHDQIDQRTTDELLLLLQVADYKASHPGAPIGTVKDVEVAARSIAVLAHANANISLREVLGLTPDNHWQELVDTLGPRLYSHRR